PLPGPPASAALPAPWPAAPSHRPTGRPAAAPGPPVRSLPAAPRLPGAVARPVPPLRSVVWCGPVGIWVGWGTCTDMKRERVRWAVVVDRARQIVDSYEGGVTLRQVFPA
ncbi:hypothetical protein ACFWS1_33175, partial [Streptomyces sp. NPDC058612]